MMTHGKTITRKDRPAFKRINDFILDETSETLWMAINKIGIVKHNHVNQETKIYTPANFDIPSVYVIQLTLDKEGKLWGLL